MRIAHISDTKGQHDLFHLSEGDVLLHTGDITQNGTVEEVESFIIWLKNQPFEHCIWIAGDYDKCFDYAFADPRAPLDVYECMHDHRVNDGSGLHYLENDKVDIWGVEFFGTPVTGNPVWAGGAAFKRYSKKELFYAYLHNKPKNVDIYLSHCPPKYTCDYFSQGRLNAGSEELRIVTKIQPPKVCCFGHIKDGYGYMKETLSYFINASAFSPDGKVNKEIRFSIDENTKEVIMQENPDYPLHLMISDLI